MSKLICVALPDGRWLALDRETFDAAIQAGADMTGSPSPTRTIAEPLLDSNQVAELTGMNARWFDDMARAGIIPHHKLGKFLRFRLSEIAEHCHVEGAAMPGSTDSQSVTPIRRLSRQ